MRIGSLFSGIGGLELGLERAGLGHTIWQVEIDPFCRAVLARHWPHAERYVDIKQVNASILSPVDLVCGGFPCQDVSAAGKGAGLAGERSGLWFEYRRIVSELRPRFVVVENVASGARRWVDTVCEGLAALGYRPRPFALSAADVGAPHLRRRVFVVADAERVELRHEQGRGCGTCRAGEAEPEDDGAAGALGDADRVRREERPCGATATRGRARASALADRNRDRRESERGGGVLDGQREALGDDAHRCSRAHTWPPQRGDVDGWREWLIAGHPAPAIPRVRRGVDGVPRGVDDRRRRLKALGNAVVPQCAEAIGRMIREMEET